MSTPTSTVPSGDKARLAENIGMILALGAAVGVGLTLFLKAQSLGAIVAGGITFLALIGFAVAYLKGNVHIPNAFVYIIAVFALAVTLPKLLDVTLPPATTSITELVYRMLPPYTSEATRHRAEDTDVHTADRIEPVGTGARKVLLATKKRLSTRVATELSREVNDAMAKTCWGWNNAEKKSIKAPCIAEINRIKEIRQAELREIDEATHLDTDMASRAPTTKSWKMPRWVRNLPEDHPGWLLVLGVGVLAIGGKKASGHH